jgi:hypothetical protein
MYDMTEITTIKGRLDSELSLLQGRIDSMQKHYEKAKDEHARGLYAGWVDASTMALDTLKRLFPEVLSNV